ncbi:MAG: hypothetical protein ABEJ28_08335 [Salinigranum sp.]
MTEDQPRETDGTHGPVSTRRSLFKLLGLGFASVSTVGARAAAATRPASATATRTPADGYGARGHGAGGYGSTAN